MPDTPPVTAALRAGRRSGLSVALVAIDLASSIAGGTLRQSAAVGDPRQSAAADQLGPALVEW